MTSPKQKGVKNLDHIQGPPKGIRLPPAPNQQECDHPDAFISLTEWGHKCTRCRKEWRY